MLQPSNHHQLQIQALHIISVDKNTCNTLMFGVPAGEPSGFSVTQ